MALLPELQYRQRYSYRGQSASSTAQKGGMLLYPPDLEMTNPTRKVQEGQERSEKHSISPPAAEKSASLANPVILLVLSSLLGIATALIVPWVGARINDSKLISEARLQTCFNVLKSSTETDSRINSMLTRMGMFVIDASYSGVVAEADVNRLRTEMERDYLEFDRQAWWWAPGLPNNVTLLRIALDSNQLRSLIAAYQSNLDSSVACLKTLRQHCAKKGYKAVDPENTHLLKETSQKLYSLQSQRADLIGKMVFLLAPSEPTIRVALTGTDTTRRLTTN